MSDLEFAVTGYFDEDKQDVLVDTVMTKKELINFLRKQISEIREYGEPEWDNLKIAEVKNHE